LIEWTAKAKNGFIHGGFEMQINGPAWMTVVGLGVILCAILLNSEAQTKPPSATPAKAYSSPQEVFDALRDATDRQDWRTVFLCQTPNARDNLVFETYFACNMHLHNPQVLAVLKKYGADPAVITADYYKRYHKKHGVDIAKLIAQRADKRAEAAVAYLQKQGKNVRAQNNRGDVVPVPVTEADIGPPLPGTDEKLFHEVVSARVADKAGFFEAANKIIMDKEMLPKIGQLTELTVRGNTATGHATKTLYHFSTAVGQTPQKGAQSFTLTYHFQKTPRGWLLEREE
jgi:hypothetical protein